ncbi:MAG: hypothetical protein ACRDRF_16270 [Pseudonocardiaceae bacterium]
MFGQDSGGALGVRAGRPVPRRHTTAAHEPATLLADSTRIQTELGWRPEKSTLPEIIADAWNALTRE